MTVFCRTCTMPYVVEDSDALEAETYCSADCELEHEASEDTEDNICQQCDYPYEGDVGDGFCSEACLEDYLAGEEL